MERPNMPRNARGFITTGELVRAAVVAALLLAVKEALRFIPNVELVTVIIIVSAYAFSPKVSFLTTFVFCTAQWLLYGFGYWVVSYYLYWPALTAAALSLKRVRNAAARSVAAVFIAAVFTAAFGVLTTAVDVLFVWGFSGSFFTYFPIWYARGLLLPYPFYIVHFVSSVATVGFLFFPLSKVLERYERT